MDFLLSLTVRLLAFLLVDAFAEALELAAEAAALFQGQTMVVLAATASFLLLMAVGLRGGTPTGLAPATFIALGIGLHNLDEGRDSIVRRMAELQVEDLGSSVDVLWIKLSRHDDDPAQQMSHAGPGPRTSANERRDARADYQALALPARPNAQQRHDLHVDQRDEEFDTR